MWKEWIKNFGTKTLNKTTRVNAGQSQIGYIGDSPISAGIEIKDEENVSKKSVTTVTIKESRTIEKIQKWRRRRNFKMFSTAWKK